MDTALLLDGAGLALSHGLTAAGAYRFGLADGLAQRTDDHRTFAPFEAHYAHGYADGMATHPADDDKPLEFGVIAEMPLPLGAPVFVAAQGIVGVISGRSTCDRQRWRKSYFNRKYWRKEHRWFARSQFVVMGSAENADEDTQALSA